MNATIDNTIRTIEDLLTGVEVVRFRSSMLIDLTEGAAYEAAVSHAFRYLWTHRVGYASRMSNDAWIDLNMIAERLGVKL